ncbi:MAG: glutamine amidotransferase [Planctomycetota bacterium]|nr:glutamine amidotransferase [Planctomycetota bacterium]
MTTFARIHAAWLAALLVLLLAQALHAQADASVRRAHIVTGLWHRFYRLDEALARAKFSITSQSWASATNGFGFAGPWEGDYGSGLEHLPALDVCATNDVIVLCNVNGRALPQELLAGLKRHVERGGGLLMLGGRFAFGPQYRGTPALAELAPVEFGEKLDLRAEPAGLALRPTDDPWAKPLAGLTWDKSPALFWRHEVKPKPGAHVVLEAGGQPALVLGTFGKGRVALFAGTVLGEPGAGTLPFWEWSDWPAALGATMDWLAEPLSAGRAEAAAAWGRELRQQVDQIGGLKIDALTARLLAALPLLDDPSTAALALRALADCDGDLSDTAWEALLTRLAPHCGEGSAAAAEALVKSGRPRKTSLGLAALGGARGAGAVATLRSFYISGMVKAGAAAVSVDPGAAGGVDGAALVATPEDAHVIRLGALVGLGMTRDAAARPVLRTALEELAGKSPGHPDGLDAVEQSFQQAWLSTLLTGDASAAPRVVDILTENIYAISRARSGGTDLEWPNLHRPTPQMLRWQQLQWEQLASAPAGVRAAIAERLAAIDEVRVAPLALAALGGKALSPEAAAALKRSPVAAVRALAQVPP